MTNLLNFLPGETGLKDKSTNIDRKISGAF